MNFFSNAQVSYIQGSINAKLPSVAIAQANKACEFIRNVTKIVNVMPRFEINRGSGTERRNMLEEVDIYLSKCLKADLLSVDTRLTIKNFIHIIDDLVP